MPLQQTEQTVPQEEEEEAANHLDLQTQGHNTYILLGSRDS